MYAHNVPIRLARTLAPHRFAAGALVALALLTAACSNDSASRITAPSLSASMDKGHSVAASSGPSLGAASGFAALAGGPAAGAVTCTASIVTGDVGVVFPGTVTGCTPTGTINTNATAAYADFLSAYDALAAVSCDQTLTGTLAGVTLSPGVYCFTAAAALTGTLTLNGPANGVWIFKIGTGGTGALTGTNFSVVMAGGAAAVTQCPNVYWWVAQGATMTDSQFLGTILAGADITVTRGTFIGDALAGGKGTTSLPTGAVTLTNTTIQSCPPAGGIVVHTKNKCNQGVGNGPEGCDPGKSNHGDDNNSNDERGGTPGDPGRQGGH
jgi:hypothetical protein